MSPRLRLVFDLFLIAFILGGLIVFVIGGALLVSGTFSWVWLARLVLTGAVLAVAVEIVLARRSLRVRQVRGPLGSWRLADRTQGCTFALVGAAVAIGLVLCGGIMDYILEWR